MAALAFETVGVVGAGTMGRGIAQVCAMAGATVLLYDLDIEVVNKAQQQIVANLDKGIARGKLTEQQKTLTLQNLQLTNDLNALKVDLVIEAIIERLDVKQQVFGQLATINGPETVLASNTSSIPITRIAAGIEHPERVVGMHFFNPAHIMKLVEVISGVATHDQVAQRIATFTQQIGKTPAMAKDSPGFIVNRVARHFYVEGLKILEEGVADVSTIDALVEQAGFKMGPFRLMDLIGVDTNFSVTSSMFEAFHQDPKFRPSRIQQQKVEAGHHGRKSGQGFYTYE